MSAQGPRVRNPTGREGGGASSAGRAARKATPQVGAGGLGKGSSARLKSKRAPIALDAMAAQKRSSESKLNHEAKLLREHGKKLQAVVQAHRQYAARVDEDGSLLQAFWLAYSVALESDKTVAAELELLRPKDAPGPRSYKGGRLTMVNLPYAFFHQYMLFVPDIGHGSPLRAPTKHRRQLIAKLGKWLAIAHQGVVKPPVARAWVDKHGLPTFVN